MVHIDAPDMHTPHQGYYPHVPVVESVLRFFEQYQYEFLVISGALTGCFLACFVIWIIKFKWHMKYQKPKTLYETWLQAKDDLDYWFYEHPKEINTDVGQYLVCYELGLLRQILLNRDFTEDEAAREKWLASVTRDNFVPQTPKEQYGH